MRRPAPLILLGAGLLVFAACSRGEDTGDVALSADEEQRLNQAAEMLDANSVALEDVTGNTTEQP